MKILLNMVVISRKCGKLLLPQKCRKEKEHTLKKKNSKEG